MQAGNASTTIGRRAFLTATTASLAIARTGFAAPRPPNIIFILADDLGRSDLGCYGQRKIRTPNIDRLAAEGMRFTQAYAAPVCAPARCTLMTGLHTGHASIRHNHSILRKNGRVSLSAEDVTVAQILKSAGYATAMFGKWGLAGSTPETGGVPTRLGFDEWLGFLDNDHAKEYYTDFLWRGERKEVIKDNLNNARRVYTHDIFTREAIRFIREHQRDRFFLYLPYTIPHGPWVVPSDAPYAQQNWTQQEKNYAAMTTRMDDDVGRIMAVLRESRLDNNTVVFFSSDNGPGFEEGLGLFGSAGRFRGRKSNLYEGGIRVPMIARWPGEIEPGAVSDQIFTFWDFLPTAADLAGAKTPSKLDGISVMPALVSNSLTNQDRPLYWEFHGGGRFQQAVRIGNWKGVRAGPKRPLELYDLSRDVGETTDVADAQPAVIARLERFLQTARTDSREYPVMGN